MGIDPYYSGLGCLQAGSYYTSSTATCVEAAQWIAWQQTSFVGTQNRIWATWTTSGTVYDQQAQMCNQLQQQALAGNQLQQAGNQLQQAGQLGQLAQGLQQWTTEDQQRYTDLQQRTYEDQKKTQEERDQAEKTARKTLVEILNDGQKESLEKEGCFYLQTGDHRYRVKLGASVERVDGNGRVLSRFCIHAPHSYKLPPSDQAICHKLMIECEPDYFFRTANETRVAA